MNLGKYAFIALIVFLVGYVTYDNPKEDNPKDLKAQNQLSAQEITFISLQSDNTLKDSIVTLQDSIVEFGIELLGTPYITAGSGKEGFDCSGFVNYVFQNFDIKVPRSSKDFENFGTEIPISDVQKGDLLLFLSPTRNAIGHIGIITNENGRESDFIHASSGREMKVIITNLSNKGYTRRFVKAIRVL